MKRLLCLAAGLVACTSYTRTAAEPAVVHDIIIRGGTVYDGSGSPPRVADIAIDSQKITFVGDLKNQTARQEVDARGLAVAPGFINMLSWATESLHRGRPQRRATSARASRSRCSAKGSRWAR